MKLALATAALLLAATPAPARAADPAAADPAYGRGGVAKPPYGRDFAALPGGGLVAAGGLAGFGVARLDARGAVVAQALVLPGEGTSGEAVAVQPDGRIVVAGSVPDGSRHVLAVARLTPELALDPSFGDGGVVRFGEVERRQGTGAVAADLDVTAGGRIVVLTDRLLLLALDPQGRPDPSFSADGRTDPLTELGRPDAGAAGTELLPLADGRTLVLGQSAFEYGDHSTSSAPLLLRIGPDGTPDGGFGTNGVATARFVLATGLALLPAGRIVVSGYSCGFYKDPLQLPCPFQLAGFTADGDPVDALSVPRTDGSVHALAPLPDGKVLLGAGGMTARLHPGGGLDLGYGECGVARTEVPVVRRLFAQPDGAVLVAGDDASRQNPAVVRLLGGPGPAPRGARPEWVPWLPSEVDASLRRGIRLPAYIPWDARVTARIELVGLGTTFEHQPLTRRMLRRLKLPRTIGLGSARVGACREKAVHLRFSRVARERLTGSRRAPFLLRMRVQVRTAGGVARGHQDLDLVASGAIQP